MDFLSEAEVSRLLKLSRATLRAWRCRGRGPGYIKAGGRVLYPVPELEKFLQYPLPDGPLSEPARGQK